jgi:NADH dehydrogenase FAD-containing subunit
VGVELMGEFVHKYKTVDASGDIILSKKLGIVQRGPRILPFFTERVSEAAHNYFT